MNTLEKDIYEELCSIATVDAHEHLPPEKEHLAKPHDFYSLFQHYCSGDLIAAGATKEDLDFFADRSNSLDQRWHRFRPFFNKIRTCSYARSAILVVQDILGFSDLNDSTYCAVSFKLEELNRPGIYAHILREHCNIEACIECWRLDGNSYPDYFFHLAPGANLIDMSSREALDELSVKSSHQISNISDLLACMEQRISTWSSDPKVVGVKSTHAYRRSIGFEKVSRMDAESVLGKVLSGKEPLSAAETISLQDFLLFELLARIESVGLPLAIHTGLQAGNFNKISNANPLLLQELISNFPKAKIDLFHGGTPWVREIAVLAKYFPGVHLNMAWMHIISPAQARAALSEWLDLVPNNKIFGFGGDYNIVEKVYGHLKLARMNIAAVLSEKIQSGAFSRSNATMIAQRLMQENPKEFYAL